MRGVTTRNFTVKDFSMESEDIGNVSMKKMITKGLMSFVRACKHALVKIRDRVQTETLIFPIQIWSTFSYKKNIILCGKSIEITISKNEIFFL